MKKKRFFSLFMVLCCILTLIVPGEYKAGTTSYEMTYANSTVYYFYETGGQYAQLSFSSQNTYVSLNTNITHFRMVVKLPVDLEKDDIVNISGLTLKVINGTFDNSDSFTWFGVPQSNIYATNSMSSIKRGVGYIGDWGFSTTGSYTITADASYFWIDYYVTGRTSTSVFQPFHGMTLDVYRDSDLSDVEGSLDGVENNTGNIFTSILNLPANIAKAIGGFFTDLGDGISDLPGGFADAIGGFFTSLGDGITGLPRQDS